MLGAATERLSGSNAPCLPAIHAIGARTKPLSGFNGNTLVIHFTTKDDLLLSQKAATKITQDTCRAEFTRIVLRAGQNDSHDSSESSD